MSTSIKTPDRISGQSPTHAKRGALGPAGRYVRLSLLIALGLSIAWQAAFAGRFLSGEAAALRLHQTGAYAVVLLGIATLIVELISGRRRRRWATAWLAGLLAAAIVTQLLLGFMSSGNARFIAYHVPLGVFIAGLYVYYITVGLRQLADGA